VLTYSTLDGDILNLSALNAGELAFLGRCRALYRAATWAEMVELVNSDGNPVLAPGRRVTNTVAAHPLYRAVRDMQDRVGIISGRLRAEPGDNVAADPFEDVFMSVPAAAALRGVTHRAVYLAIDRGELVAGDRPVQVSRRSLDRWVIDESRRHARKASAAAGAAAG
jgi:hypothetical protein